MQVYDGASFTGGSLYRHDGAGFAAADLAVV
jgi:hypothetical protein